MLLAKCLNAACMLLSSALLTRLLPPEQVGAYFMAYAAVLVLSHLCNVGLGHASARLIAETTARGDAPSVYAGLIRRIVVTTALTVTVGISAVAVCFEPLLAPLGSNGALLSGTGLLVGLWAGAQAARVVAVGLLRGSRRMGLAALFDGVVANLLLVTVLGAAFVLDADMSFREALGLSIWANFVSTTLAAFALRQALRVGMGPAVPFPASRLFAVSLPIMTTLLLPVGAVQGTLWIIGALGSPEEVALYGAASRLYYSLGLLLMVSELAGGPLVTELHTAGDRDRIRHVARLLAAVAALPAVGAVLLFLLFGRELMALIFGGFYADAAAVVLILSMARALQIGLGLNSMLLMMTGHERSLALVQSAAALTLLTATVLGYRAAGINGASLGVASAIALEALVLAVLVRRRLGFWPYASPDPRLVLAFVRRRFA